MLSNVVEERTLLLVDFLAHQLPCVRRNPVTREFSCPRREFGSDSLLHNGHQSGHLVLDWGLGGDQVIPADLVDWVPVGNPVLLPVSKLGIVEEEWLVDWGEGEGSLNPRKALTIMWSLRASMGVISIWEIMLTLSTNSRSRSRYEWRPLFTPIQALLSIHTPLHGTINAHLQALSMLLYTYG